ncbi:N-acetylmuramoyl-L-alanine amidase [Collinsella ihumii]|uniref:N-acetylmuramoyl-L-alanine amidase n=1 Tax=Collinsella ihumii TaxID=1720204 RepID=A0AAW7JS51_9ACTN|nr:N-acetylmuramoyl-L-alanine amidase [Collinsella ihumii]MDN0068618.1 N-acetylmuramoyl-L-alanine amidase [Collinsella ihumii]
MAYSILFKQCGSDHMTRGRSRAIDRIVVHFTATLASARNNATYFSRNEGQGASAHYFVDDITPEIYQSVAEGDTAWHAGDWQMNCRAIGIEVVSAGEDFSATEVEKLGWLVRKLMAKYGIGASGVIRHYDVTGKLCPAPYVAASKWAALKAAITGGVVSGGTTPAAPGGTVAELARRVIAGEFGNGDARRAALGSRYSEVQAEVNRILAGGSSSAPAQPAAPDIEALAQAVIRGDYGNGDDRRAALGSTYDAVQARVNEILGAGGSDGGSGGADIDALARAVIRGEYGNGEERRSRLGPLYDAVQARVNEILL